MELPPALIIGVPGGLLTVFVLYLIKNFGTQARRDDYTSRTNFKCAECLGVIPREAKKCMHCGSSVL